MSKEAVRCIYVPVKGAPEELILPVEDGKFFAEKKLGGTPRLFMLPDHVVFITKAEDTLIGPPNVRIAGFTARGPIIIGRLDSMSDPCSLTDEQAAFYKLAAEQEVDTTPIDLGADREIMIADVTVTYRKVRLPIECKCGANLTRNDALMLWSYTDEAVTARLPRYVGDQQGSVPLLGVLMSETSPSPRPGEGWIKNVAATCRACGNVLIEGEMKNDDPSE